MFPIVVFVALAVTSLGLAAAWRQARVDRRRALAGQEILSAVQADLYARLHWYFEEQWEIADDGEEPGNVVWHACAIATMADLTEIILTGALAPALIDVYGEVDLDEAYDYEFEDEEEEEPDDL